MKILIIVDVQNDFCPGGNLEVEEGDRIIPNINKLSNSGKFDMIIATQDWHSYNHISFASQHEWNKPFDVIEVPYGKQTLWPDHCIQGTVGAEFRPDLDQRPIQFILRKGYRQNLDSYSAFCENDMKTSTGLAMLLNYPKHDRIKIYIVGIAFDVCVKFTALDAVHAICPDIFVVGDACAGITSEGVEEAKKEFERWGIKVISTSEV